MHEDDLDVKHYTTKEKTGTILRIIDVARSLIPEVLEMQIQNLRGNSKVCHSPRREIKHL